MINHLLNRRLRTIGAYLIFCLLIILTINCADFLGLGPNKEDLESPPDPPLLIAPEDSALFYTFDKIDFEWHKVIGAEYYEIKFETKSGSTFSWQAQSTTSVDHRFVQDHYLWSVRGYSSNWTDYTAWSEERFMQVSIPIDQNSKLIPNR